MISVDAKAQKVVAAIEARDADAYFASLRELVEAVQPASPDEIAPALPRLGRVLSDAPLGPISDLVQIVGAMAGRVSDTTPVLGVLVERACQAMEGAARFAALHRELVGD